MIQKLGETLHFTYEPNSYNCKPIWFEVTTEEGLREVARLAMQLNGCIHFASAEQFRDIPDVGCFGFVYWGRHDEFEFVT